MQMVQPITLPQTEAFYTRNFHFDVELVNGACKNYVDGASPTTPYSLTLDAAMQAILLGYGSSHSACLGDIAAAAVQFFRTSANATETLDHIELRFLLAYDFGRVMSSGAVAHDPDRLGPATAKKSMRHGEAVKKTSEMFGYGLTLHYVASALGIPTDWFTFILGSGSRTDFVAEQSLDDLIAVNPTLKTLGPSGQRIYVEVKARVGWASMREENDVEGLLLNCAKKAASCSDGIVLSILIAIPGRSDSPDRTPSILVADPNSPEPLPLREQAIFVLERYLFQAQRYGLDLLKLYILRWLASLDVELTESQLHEKRRLQSRYSQVTDSRQPLLPSRPIGERTYQGRYFYSLIERLGAPRNRQLTLEQALSAIDGGDLGTKYFAGVDTDLMEIIAKQGTEDPDLQNLVNFGVRGKSNVDLSAKSAFREQQLVLDDRDREEVRSVIVRAIETYRLTNIW